MTVVSVFSISYLELIGPSRGSFHMKYTNAFIYLY